MPGKKAKRMSMKVSLEARKIRDSVQKTPPKSRNKLIPLTPRIHLQNYLHVKRTVLNENKKISFRASTPSKLPKDSTKKERVVRRSFSEDSEEAFTNSGSEYIPSEDSHSQFENSSEEVPNSSVEQLKLPGFIRQTEDLHPIGEYSVEQEPECTDKHVEFSSFTQQTEDSHLQSQFEYSDEQNLTCSVVLERLEFRSFKQQNVDLHPQSKYFGEMESPCPVEQLKPSSQIEDPQCEDFSEPVPGCSVEQLNFLNSILQTEDSHPPSKYSVDQKTKYSHKQVGSPNFVQHSGDLYLQFEHSSEKETDCSVEQLQLSSVIQQTEYFYLQTENSGYQESGCSNQLVEFPSLLQQNDASSLCTTEILKVGDNIHMSDVDLLYSPVRNSTENIVTVQCKRRLKFSPVKNISEENVPQYEHTVKENCFTTTISKKSIRKRHFCPFCKKFQLAFGRHVLKIHKNEQTVQNILTYSKNSIQRKKELASLRGRGMHMFNMENKEKNATLVVRNPKTSDPDTFVPCPNCMAYFSPRNLARHHMNCIKRPPNRIRVLKMATNLRNTFDNTLLNKLLSDFKQDEITEVIRKDKTLLLLATSMAIKYAREKHLGGFMRQKLRQLSRLLITVKQIDHTVTDFQSCLVPQKYDTIREAVYKLCELNTDTFTYKRPSMASQLGAMIKDCVNVLKLDNIKMGLNDPVHQKHLDDFLLVHEKEYGSLIAKSALSTLAQKKWNKTQVLPSVEDIQIFQEYIKTRAEKSYLYLKNVGFKYNEWLCLARSCLLMLLTFNRRRVGEISRVFITNYENRQSISNEQLTSLNRLECILASTFERMEIRGKKGRRVPVLLTKSHVNYIDMILKMRDKAGVPISNPFLFGVNSKGKYIDAGIIIREFSLKCGASRPDTLRGTYLRKQVATISQILNLNDNEIQQLADFMGHDVTIHRLHYRQPEISLQITKLAKFFMAAGEINMNKYRGKTLEELQTINNDNQVNNKDDTSSSEDNDCDSPKKSSHLPLPNSDPVSYSTHSDNSQISNRPSPSSDSINHKAHLDNYQPSNQSSPNSKSVYHRTPTKRHQNCQDPNYSPNESDGTPRKRKYSFSPRNCFQSPVKRITHKKVPWSKEERKIIFKEFKNNLETNTIPSRIKCEELKQNYKEPLKRRTVAQIRAFVNNINKKK